MINNINVYKIKTFGWENAILGMRYPMNSEDKSDSTVDVIINNKIKTKFIVNLENEDIIQDRFLLGEKDKELLLKLCKAGKSHRKVLRMIHIQMSVKMPLFWWKEFDTYKVATVANSRSTMHKLGSKKLTINDFAYKSVPPEETIETLNYLIEGWNKAKKSNDCSNNMWRSLIEYLPSSYIQERMLDFNYETALSIYFDRKNHKLEEWHYFCNKLLELPYFVKIKNEITNKINTY